MDSSRITVGDQLQDLLKDMESEVNRVSLQFSPGIVCGRAGASHVGDVAWRGHKALDMRACDAD